MKQVKKNNKKYVFIMNYQKYKKGELISNNIASSFLRMLLNKEIIAEATESTLKKINDEILIEKEKEMQKEKERILILSSLKNNVLQFSVRVDSNLCLINPIEDTEIIEKLTKLSGIKRIKIVNGIKKIDKLGTYIYKCLVEELYEVDITVIIKEAPLKGLSKRIGLKSTIVKDDSIYLTSFGKGNDSNIEHKVLENSAIKIADEPTFFIENINDSTIYLKKENIISLADKPNYSKESNKTIRMDYLEKKPELEMKYFGKTFDDNIHIQLIYNIMDIKKILSLYVEDINYVICSLGRQEKVYDLMGTLKYELSYDDFLEKSSKRNIDKFDEFYQNSKDYFLYYPQVLDKDFSKKETNDKSKKDIYTILRILSMCRQFVKHNNENNFDILKIDSIYEPYMHDIFEKINRVYNNGFNQLHSKFAKNSEKNLYLILKILGLDITPDNIKTVLSKLYKISVCKENALLGFDFKKVREKLLEKANVDFGNEDKGMYYQIINYLIYENLDDNLVENVVKQLRSSESFGEKEIVYSRFVNKLFEHTPLKKLLTKKLLDVIAEVKLDKNNNYFSTIDINEIFTNIVHPSDTMFDKLLYFLTCFLDSKETNMLLVSMINKLQNIKGLVKLIKLIYQTDKLHIKDDFKMFEEEKVDEYIIKLNQVMNLTKMQKNVNKISKSKENSAGKNKIKYNNSSMFFDAYRMFGASSTEIKDIHEKVYSSKGVKKNRKQSLRNFIISKIINSNKFRYVVEYANPEDVSYILKNDKIVEFVLNNIPHDKIIKHCAQAKITCMEREAMIKELKNKIQKLNINYIIENYDNDEDCIAILSGLYITIIYLVIKNLVRINSYYSIAFSCLERDRGLYDYKEVEDIDIELVNLFIEKNKFKNRTKNWIINNNVIFNNVFNLPTQKTSVNEIYRSCFRNKVVHLSALTNIKDYICDFKQNQKNSMHSYFELYHYIMQRIFICEYEKKTTWLREKDNEFIKWKMTIEKYQTYFKDMLHIICMPFAYNLARYKNLSIEDIFYDSYKDNAKLK